MTTLLFPDDMVTVTNIPQLRPITNKHVQHALLLRDQLCIHQAALEAQIVNSKICIWNTATLYDALDASKVGDRLLSSPYCDIENPDNYDVLYRPPYLDRLHMFPESMWRALVPGYPTSETNESFGMFATGFFWRERELEIPELSVLTMYTDSRDRTHKPLIVDVHTYQPTANQQSYLMYYLLEIFMNSNCAVTENRSVRPEAAVTGHSRGKVAKRPYESIRVVIKRNMVRLEKKQTEQRLAQIEREKIATGKSWILDHESVTEGHWRNQWYPSIGRHEKIFIESFVRGVGKGGQKTENIRKVVR